PGQVARVPAAEIQPGLVPSDTNETGDAPDIGDNDRRRLDHGLDGDHSKRLFVDRGIDDCAAYSKERVTRFVADKFAPQDREAQVPRDLAASFDIVPVEGGRPANCQLEFNAAGTQDLRRVEQEVEPLLRIATTDVADQWETIAKFREHRADNFQGPPRFQW